MRDVDLFQVALGLERPWYVERSEFDPEQRRLDLYIDFTPGGTFRCPECGRAGSKAYDTTEKTWRHLNFFQHEAYLHVRTPRVRCPEHGVKLVEVPSYRKGAREHFPGAEVTFDPGSCTAGLSGRGLAL